MEPDIYINVRFRTTSEGGRRAPVNGEFYGCPLTVGNQAYECRLLIKIKELKLGEFYDVPVKFLNIDLALPYLSIGKNFTLWEGRNIADGKITKIQSKN